MESKNLIYKNGHIYDQESKKRVKLADGAPESQGSLRR